MQEFVNTVTGVFDQLNPFNAGNLLVYFTWIVIYTFTWMAIWRSRAPWLRFVSFVVNQLLSVGIVLSWTLTGLLAYTYWMQSLAAFVVTACVGFYAFRRRR
ncbi:MAG: hypothetical protein ACREEE_00475 [Dongiaceae bacterium]